MSCDWRGDTVEAVMKRLLVVGIVLLAAAGCSSTHGKDRAQWAGRAASADVVAARARAEREANTVIAHLPVNAATVASADSCVVGERDLWYTSQYQFGCHLDTIYYVPVDGALLPELVRVDEAARAAPLGLVPSEPFQNVQYYFAYEGKDTDGLHLPRPGMAYSGGGCNVGVGWRDPAFPDPDLPQLSAVPTDHPMLWPQVYRSGRPAVDLPKLVAAHDNVLAISVSQTYFTIPWSSR
jgi:hypothetical protein